MVAVVVGIIFGPHVLGLVDVGGWGNENTIILEVSRLIVSIQLLATGLR